MNTTKELVDAAGFDVILDEMGVFAVECANIPNQSPECKKVFEEVANLLADCNRKVSRLLLTGMEFYDRAQVIANMTDFNLEEVLNSELEPGAELDAATIAKIPDHPATASEFIYELIPDHEVYQVLTKEELYKRGIDLFNENISQQTDKYWVLTIH